MHGWEWTILVLLKNKKISSRGPGATQALVGSRSKALGRGPVGLSPPSSHSFLHLFFFSSASISRALVVSLSCEGTPCLYHACAKEDGGLAGGSAVKCREAIFANVAKRKSLSRTLYTCWNRVKKKKRKEILILKVWFYGNSVELRQSPTHEYGMGGGGGQ